MIEDQCVFREFFELVEKTFPDNYDTRDILTGEIYTPQGHYAYAGGSVLENIRTGEIISIPRSSYYRFKPVLEN